MKGSTDRSTARSDSRWSNDLDLTEAAASGDRVARRVLAERLMGRVRTTVRYLSGNHGNQDDYVQISLLEVLRSASNYAGRSSLEAWCDRIVIRTTMRHIKKHRAKDNRTESLQEVPVLGFESPDDPHDRIAIRRHLAKHLGFLSPKRRTVLVLKLVYGYSIEEIAEMTDAPDNTVRDRLARGRRKLKERIEKDPVFSNWVAMRSL